ncbi:MAG: GGDEF domain-containing protein [Brachymonas sp.]
MSKKKKPVNRSREHNKLQAVEESQVLDRVSFRLRAREQVLGWALAAYCAWVGIVVVPGLLMPWVGVVVASSVAAWARLRPARRPGKVALRYCLLAMAGLLLLIEPKTGHSVGPMVVWPVAIVCSSVFMLRERWAAIPVTLTIAVFFAASAGILPRVPWGQVLTALAAMVAAMLLAHAFGSALRNTDAQLEAAMTDLKTKLYNEAGFFTYGAELLAQCQARRKPLCMVLLNGADMRDIHDLVGRIASERLLLKAVQGITAALLAGGLAASMGHAEFALLLPDTSSAHAQELVRDKLGDPPTAKLTIQGQSISVVLDMLGSDVPPDARNLEPLYERLYAQLSKMRRGLDAPTTMTGAESYMPDLQREISPTLPMALMRK